MSKNRVIFYIHNGVHLLDLSGAVQAFYEAEEFGHPYEMVYVGGTQAPTASAGLPFMRLEHFSTVEPGAGDVLIVAGFGVGGQCEALALMMALRAASLRSALWIPNQGLVVSKGTKN